MFTGSITALVTPFLKEGGIDFLSLKKLIEKQILEEVDGLVVAGTTGEGPTLSKEEFCELLTFVLKEVGGKCPVIAGTGTNCTSKSVEMTRVAKEIGADGAILIVPYYNKPTDRGVLAHFREIGKVGLPYIAYHHPGRCGIELDVESLVELTKYDYLVGIKDCSNHHALIREVLEKAPEAVFLTGNDEGVIGQIRRGMKGSISVIGNLFPGYWKAIVDLALKGQFSEAEALYVKIQPLLWALSLEVNPQPIKCALQLDVLRLPLLSVEEDTKEEIYEAIKAFSTAEAVRSLAK